jgi:hypothetical protein
MRLRLWAAGIAVVTLGLGPAAANAETLTEDFPVSAVITSSCTGEMIAIEGTLHFKQTNNSTATGTKSQIEVNATGVKGTTLAPVMGVRYVSNEQMSDMQHADLDSAQVTVENTVLLTRAGETGTFLQGDDLRFHMIAHLTFSNGMMRVEKVDMRDECR